MILLALIATTLLGVLLIGVPAAIVGGLVYGLCGIIARLYGGSRGRHS